MDPQLKSLLYKGLSSQFEQFPKANLIYLVNARLRSKQLIGEPLAQVVRNNANKFITDLGSTTQADNVIFYFDVDFARLKVPIGEVFRDLADRIVESRSGRYNYQGIIVSLGTSDPKYPTAEPCRAALSILGGLDESGLPHDCMDLSAHYIGPDMEFEPGEYRANHLISFKLSDYQDAEVPVHSPIGEFLDISDLVPAEFDDGVVFANEKPATGLQETVAPADTDANLPAADQPAPVKVSASEEAIADHAQSLESLAEAVREMGPELQLGLALHEQDGRVSENKRLKFIAFDLVNGANMFRAAIANVAGQLLFAAIPSDAERGPSFVIEKRGNTVVVDLGESEPVMWDDMDMLSFNAPLMSDVASSFVRALALETNDGDQHVTYALDAQTLATRVGSLKHYLNLDVIDNG